MVALGAATREALRMADALEAMLHGLREAYNALTAGNWAN